MPDLTLTEALHLLYEPASSRHWTGVHSIKFDVEHLMWIHKEGTYVTDDAVRNALLSAGFLSRTQASNHTVFQEFCVKPRFPMTWVWNDVRMRPKGVKKAQWGAYSQARRHPESPTESSASAEGSP